MHELSVDKINRGINVPRALDRMVKKHFSRPEDKDQIAPAYIRALTEAVGPYDLTPEDYRQIAEEMEQALKKRMVNRAKRKGSK